MYNEQKLRLCVFCSIALFGSESKGKLFIPNAEEKKCKIIASKTGNLADIDVELVKDALKVFENTAPAPLLV